MGPHSVHCLTCCSPYIPSVSGWHLCPGDISRCFQARPYIQPYCKPPPRPNTQWLPLIKVLPISLPLLTPGARSVLTAILPGSRNHIISLPFAAGAMIRQHAQGAGASRDRSQDPGQSVGLPGLENVATHTAREKAEGIMLAVPLQVLTLLRKYLRKHFCKFV